MRRKLKALGLALATVFATTAMLASAAQATENPLQLTAGAYPALLTGEMIEGNGHVDHIFVTTGGSKVTCKKVKFYGTIASTEENERVTITPTYEECNASGLPVTVIRNHCDYEFHGGLDVDGTGHEFEQGTVDLLCPAGKVVEIEIFANGEKHANGEILCKLTIPPFINKGENTYTNTSGPSDDVDVTTNVRAIAVTRDGSILCGAVNQTATYTGYTTLTAWEDEGFSVSEGSNTQTSYTVTEGNQLDLTASETE